MSDDKNKLGHGVLAGKRKYVLIGVTVVSAIAYYLVGDVDLAGTVQAILGALVSEPAE